MAAAMRWPVEAEGGRFIDDIAGLAETFQANAKKMFMNTEGTDIGAFVIGSFGMSFPRKSCKPFLNQIQDAEDTNYVA
jgi:hypothetical protein